MKATDLMIEDWVQVPSLIDNVEHYDAWCKVRQLRDCDLDVIGFKELKYDEIVPIPLTPEILEKNGFERRDDLVVDDEFLPFILERLDTDECFEIVVYWRDSYSNGAADAFNEVSWDEYWKLHILSGPSLYEYETGNCIYVHELQHSLKLCGVKKEIVL